MYKSMVLKCSFQSNITQETWAKKS